MSRRLLGAVLVAGLVATLFSSCSSSSSSSTPPPTTGTVFTFIGDTPLDDILTFRVLVTDVTLTLQSGTGTYHAFPTNGSVKVNFAAWQDDSTFLSITSLTPGTYSSGSLVISIPQLVLYDPTQSPPIRVVTATLPSTTPTFTIEPPLTVTAGVVSAMSIDFDLLHSLQFQADSTGALTAAITPAMTFAALSSSGSQQSFGPTSARGFVQSVAPTSTTTSANNTAFVGNFVTQLLSPNLSQTAPAVTVNLTSATTLCGPMAPPEQCPTVPLNTLMTGSFTTVNGFLDSKGNFIANSAELEDQEVVANNKVAFLGPILSVTKDANGNVTQFTLFVREEHPDVEFNTPGVQLDVAVTVTPSASTVYADSSRVAHPGSLQYGPTSLVAGQEVAVSGVFTPPPSGVTPAPPTTVAADSVYLQSQAYGGHFSSLLQRGSDDKSGAFTLATSATIFHGATMMVFTDGSTTFLNVAGLSELTPQPTLVLKGLLFFDQQGRTINGVTVPPGSLVLLASQVHQL